MTNSLNSRRRTILGLVIRDYIATGAPIGSRAMLDRYELGISPATIRNEMAVLEEEGLITQPYTSAGRIPTDLGYRTFVDQLASVKPLSAPERRAIETFLEGALDLDDVVMRTVKLLADVTKQVAVVQYPSLVKSKVRHVELVLLNSIRTMLILITDTGRVEQRVIELATDVDDEFLNSMRIKLNNSIAGQRLPDVADRLSALMDSLSQSERRNMAVVISTLIEMALEKPEEKVVLAGTANLTRFRQDFSAQIHPILEALEEQVVLLRLLGGASNGVQVRIGSEQNEANLQETSVISMGYGEVGALGVIGPTRMDYASSMAAVSAVANYVSRYLQENA